jgi:hypothetical protein
VEYLLNIEEYKRLFKLIAKTEGGEVQRLEEIESHLLHLKEGRALTYSDLQIIADPQYWPFTKYWMWPDRNQIANKLETTAGFFKDLPKGEIAIIRRLNAIFKNIALVSIILRFARPDLYAIYSWPVLQILRIERGKNAVEEYMNYIIEIRILKDCFDVERVSEVDKIVWAIFHLQGKYAIELKKMLADRLPENLTPEELIVYLSHSPLRIAKAYQKQKAFMNAGFWAAKGLEKFLDEECRYYGLFIPEGPFKRFKMINKLCQETLLWSRLFNRRLLYETKKLRNKIIPGIENITGEDVERFIINLEQLKNIALHRG